MKKRVLSALLVLCLACSLVSTAWAAAGRATPESAGPAGWPQRTVEQTLPQTSDDLPLTALVVVLAVAAAAIVALVVVKKRRDKDQK